MLKEVLFDLWSGGTCPTLLRTARPAEAELRMASRSWCVRAGREERLDQDHGR